jgi:hypothetical protein
MTNQLTHSQLAQQLEDSLNDIVKQNRLGVDVHIAPHAKTAFMVQVWESEVATIAMTEKKFETAMVVTKALLAVRYKMEIMDNGLFARNTYLAILPE